MVTSNKRGGGGPRIGLGVVLVVLFIVSISVASAQPYDGACILHHDPGSYTTPPLTATSPDSGTDYVKVHIPGMNQSTSPTEMQTFCTPEIANTLLSQYCATQSSDNLVYKVATFSDAGTFWNSGLAHQVTSPISCNDLEGLSIPNGSCIIKAQGVTPLMTDPDQGTNYIKQHTPGANWGSDVVAACTRDIFDQLMDTYCGYAQDHDQVMYRNWHSYNPDGTLSSERDCSVDYCEAWTCNEWTANRTVSGSCVVIGGNTLIPSNSFDPDVGTAYVKTHISGVNELSTLESMCDSTILTQLLDTYCTSPETAGERDSIRYYAATYSEGRRLAEVGLTDIGHTVSPIDGSKLAVYYNCSQLDDWSSSPSSYTVITNYSSTKLEPKISGDRIVWTEMVNFASSGADVYLYDGTTGSVSEISVEHPIECYDSRTGQPVTPCNSPFPRTQSRADIDGNRIVYLDTSSMCISSFGGTGTCSVAYVKDLTNGNEFELDPTTKYVEFPKIDGDYVVYRTLDWANDSAAFYIKNLVSGQRTTIESFSVPHYNIDGDYVVYGDDQFTGNVYLYHIPSGAKSSFNTPYITPLPDTDGIYVVYFNWQNPEGYMDMRHIATGAVSRVATPGYANTQTQPTISEGKVGYLQTENNVAKLKVYDIASDTHHEVGVPSPPAGQNYPSSFRYDVDGSNVATVVDSSGSGQDIGLTQLAVGGFCGDQTCSGSETSQTCPSDCGAPPPPPSNATPFGGVWQTTSTYQGGHAMITSSQAVGDTVLTAFVKAFAQYNQGSFNTTYITQEEILLFSKTTGGGVSTNSTIYQEYSTVLNPSLHALDENNIFVSFFVGYPVYEYKLATSTDGGATWTLNTIDLPGPVNENGANSLHVLDSQNMVVAFQRWPNLWLAKSTDGGSTWSKSQVETAPAGLSGSYVGKFSDVYARSMNDIDVIYNDLDIISFGVEDQNIYFAQTTDGGSTWSKTGIDKGGQYLAADRHNNAIYVSFTGQGQGLRVMKSLDQGTTWSSSEVNSSGGFATTSLVLQDENHAIFAVYNAYSPGHLYAYESVDGGASWTSEQITPEESTGFGVSLVKGDTKLVASHGEVEIQNYVNVGGSLELSTKSIGSSPPPPPQSTSATAPVLLFSDMISAPKTGWDGSATQGAAVTIWGNHLGDSRGSSYVTVNGVALTADTDYAVWGEYWPTQYQQRITFWLNDQMSDGPGQITVTVNGQTSNPLDFTIRNGRIFFVASSNPAGNGDGSIANPYLFSNNLIQWGSLRQGLGDGDILYFRAGTYTGIGNQGNYIMRIDNEASSDPNNPFSMIAYPGEKPLFQTTSREGGIGMASNMVISGFSLDTIETSIRGQGSHIRIVGNDADGIHRRSGQGTGIITSGRSSDGAGSQNHILGNAVHGGIGGYRLDHAIYLSGCSDDGGALVAWNHIYDNDFGRGPLISINHMDDNRLNPPNRCKDGPPLQIMDSHYVFNNRVECYPQRATAINVYQLSYKQGEPEPEPTYVYNNIFDGCGTFEPSNSDVGWAISTNHQNGHAEWYHNVWYNTGYVGLQFGGGENRLSTTVKNNIFHMNKDVQSGRPTNYLGFSGMGNNDFSTVTFENNILFGADDPYTGYAHPITDNNNVEADPLFVDPTNGDFRLQEGSPAIDHGQDITFAIQPPAWADIARDHAYQLRSSIDAGPFEYITEQSTISLTLTGVPAVTSNQIVGTAQLPDSTWSTCEVCVAQDQLCDTEWTTTGVSITQNTCTITINPSSFASDYHAVQVRTSNGSDTLESNTVLSFFDTQPPLVESVVVSSIVQPSQVVSFSLNISENYNMDSAVLEIATNLAKTNQTLSLSSSGGTSYSASGTFTAPSDFGSFNLTVYVWDEAGNMNSRLSQPVVQEQITWSEEIALQQQTENLNSVALTSAIAGSLHLAWEQVGSGSPQIYYSSIDSSGDFSIFEQQITTTNYNSQDPFIDVDGDTVISWTDDRDGNPEIYFSVLDSDGDVQVDQKRATANNLLSEQSQAYITNGIIDLYWLDNRQGSPTVYHKSYTDSGSLVSFDQPIINDVVDAFDAVHVYNQTAIVYQKSNSLLFAYYNPANGSTQVFPLTSNAKSFGFDAAHDTGFIAFIDTSDALHLARVPLNQPSLVNEVILAQSVDEVALDATATGLYHLTWATSGNQSTISYLKVDSQGTIHYSENGLETVGGSVQALSVGKSSDVAFVTQNSSGSTLSIKTTTTNGVSPIIEDAATTTVKDRSASLSWETSEPSTTVIRYGGLSRYDHELKTDHFATLLNLNPGNAYTATIESTDIFGNTRISSGIPFNTLQVVNQPALPTTFYGRVLYANGTRVEGETVTALWQDTNDEWQNSTTRTLTYAQAQALGDTSLVGHYLFNTGSVQAKAASTISVSAFGMTSAPASLTASPGGSSVDLTDQALVIDGTPPNLVITTPLAQTYPTTSIPLDFTVDDSLALAQFSLNGGAWVTITNTPFTINGVFGNNFLTVNVTNLVGLSSTETVQFTIQDNLAPNITTIPISSGQGVISLQASMIDESELSPTCEVCVTNDGVCDTEWVSATSSVQQGDLQGTCTYNWDSSQVSDGTYFYNFRGYDQANNVAYGSVQSITTDNTAPSQVTTVSVSSLLGQPSLHLQWQPVFAPDLSHYQIYRSSGSFSSTSIAAPLTTTTETTYIDSGLLELNTYYYAVVAVDTQGNALETVQSVPGTVADITPPQLSLLSPITGSYSATTHTVTWSASEQTSYCNLHLNGGTIPATQGMQITGQQGLNTLYVECADLSNNTAISDASNFIIDTVAPNPIAPLTLSQIDANSLQVSWTPGEESDIAQYLVYVYPTDFSSTSGLGITTTTSASSTMVSGLVAEATYYAAVVAVDHQGNQNTNVVTFSLTLQDVSPPPSLGAPEVNTVFNETTLEISWGQSTASDFAEYRVYRDTQPFVSTTGIQPIVTFSNVTSTQFTDGGLIDEATYYYAVTAVDLLGNENSDITAALGVVADITPPAISLFSPQQGEVTSSVNVEIISSELVSYCDLRLDGTLASLSVSQSACTNGSSCYHLTTSLGIAEGTHSMAVECYDISSHQGVSELISFTVDTTPPAQVQNLQGTYVDQSIQLSWDDVGESGVTYYVYRSTSPIISLDSAPFLTSLSSTSFTDTQVSSDTTYYYAVGVQDSAGNTQSAFVQEIVSTPDLTPPVVSILSPQEQTYTDSSVLLSISTNEPATCTYALNAGPSQPYNGQSIIVGEGDHLINFSCADNASNVGTAQVTFSVDTIAPALVTGVQADSVSGTTDVRVSWDASGASDLNHYEVYASTSSFTDVSQAQSQGQTISTTLDTSGWQSEETVYVAVVAGDTAGNFVTTVTPTVGQAADVIAPGQISSLSLNVTPGTSTVVGTWSAPSDNDVAGYYVYRSESSFSSVEELQPLLNQTTTSFVDNTASSETTYHYAVVAYDEVENYDPAVNAVSITTPDITPPTITITSPTPGSYATDSFTLSVDTSEAVTSCSYTLNGQVTPVTLPTTITAQQGVNTVSVSCQDLAGNNGDSTQVQFSADTVAPPSIIGLQATNSLAVTAIDLSWNPSPATDLSVYKIYRSTSSFSDVSGLTPLQSTSSTTYQDVAIQSEQTYYYAVTAVDLLGNEETTVTPVSVTAFDSIPPQVIITSPTQTLIGSSQITLSYSVNEPVNSCQYRLDGGSYQPISGSIPLTLNDGAHTIDVECTDFGSNTGSDSVTFTIDTTPPGLVTDVSVSPVAGQEQLLISWTSPGDGDIADYVIYRSDSSFTDVSSQTSIGSTPSLSFTDSNLVSEQTYWYAVVARDGLAQYNSSVIAVNGTVADLNPPGIVNGTVVTQTAQVNELNISWNTVSDADHYSLYREETSFTNITGKSPHKENIQQISVIDDLVEESTRYYYGVTATDAAGNEQSEVIPVLGIGLDLTAPTITTTNVGDPISGQITLTAHVQDFGSGLDINCEVCISDDGTCDSEWTGSGVFVNHSSQDTTGLCSYNWDTTQGQFVPHQYGFRISDASGNNATSTILSTTVIDAQGLTSWQMNLDQGWNLMAIPVTPLDTSPSAVLSSVAGSYSRVFRYDAQTGQWTSFSSDNSAFTSSQDLTSIVPGQSYWIEMTAPATLSLSGQLVSNTTYDLKSGWNYIGYPYITTDPIEQALGDISPQVIKVYSYDTAQQKWDIYRPEQAAIEPNTITHMEPGIGYLALIQVDTTWQP